MQKIGKIIGSLLVGLVAFYLTCLAYRLAAQLLFYAAMVLMIGFYVLGVKLTFLAALSALFGYVRDSDLAMYVTAAIVCLAAIFLVFKLFRESASAEDRRVALAVTGLAFLTGIGADAYYGITPWSEASIGRTEFNAGHRTVAYTLSVEDIMSLPDNKSGAFVQSEGILAYIPGRDRFSLGSLQEPGRAIHLFFYKGRRTHFSEMAQRGKPRYYDAVAHLVGQRVKVAGICVNGQIDVEVNDIEPIGEDTLKARN